MPRWLCGFLLACGSARPPAPVANNPPPPPPPPHDDCPALLDHMVDLELAQAAAASPREKKRVRESIGPSFLDACHSLTRARITCALAAQTLEAMQECDR